MVKIIISIKNISKTYDMGEVKVEAIKNINFDIKQGEFIIIKGRSGSGKSTLLRQLGLLDKPTNGEIFLDKKEVTKLSSYQRSKLRLKKIGYVFQEFALIEDLTALDNVMLPAMMFCNRKQAKQKARILLKKVGLDHREKNLPKQLSGGEKQRVAIARALINSPELIFADEPTANLDTISAKGIVNIFDNLNKEGHTIVMVTHEPEDEIYANRLITLKDGKKL